MNTIDSVRRVYGFKGRKGFIARLILPDPNQAGGALLFQFSYGSTANTDRELWLHLGPLGFLRLSRLHVINCLATYKAIEWLPEGAELPHQAVLSTVLSLPLPGGREVA